MESSYGIGVKNRYAVFIGDEEEDPLELLAKSVDQKAAVKASSGDKHSAPAAGRAVKALNDSKLSNSNHQNIIKDRTQKDSLIKPKTADGLQSKPKETVKGDSNRLNRPKTDRTQRPRDVRETTGDKPNHIGDRQNRPPRPFGEQKDIDDAKNQRNRDDRFGGNNNSNNEMRRERSDSDRRGGRNGSRGGGSRRGGGGRFPDDQRRGKRDLDRHSGSDKAGVKAVEKREGGGSHNWGKINDFSAADETADNQDMADKSADETALEINDSNPEIDANATEESVPAVEEPKEMTLEEYKQQIEEHRVQPKFNLRKPGEGEDNSQWKKTYLLKKKVEDEEEIEYEEIEVEEDPRKGRHKQILDIQINFSRDEGRDFPRRGDRGGRGGGRDRRNDDRGDRGDRPDRGDRRDRGGERGGHGGERGERGGDRGERGGDRPERGGDRGDRGGERGERGGRGGPRGGGRPPFDGDRKPFRRPRDAKEQSAPKVDDWNDFPSLSTA